MNKSQIDNLLEKYWNAETTLEEESTLGKYFNSHQVDDAHQEYIDLFQYYHNSGGQLFSSEITLTPELVSQYDKRNSLIVRFRPLLKYAAALAFLFFAYSICMNQFSIVEAEPQYAGKYTEFTDEEDAEEALAITMEALSFLTAKINKTEKTISNNFIPIQKAMKVIN